MAGWLTCCGAGQVDDSGKVQRLRKVCPTCGPGIFMATHFNRVYWCAPPLLGQSASAAFVTSIFCSLGPLSWRCVPGVRDSACLLSLTLV